MSSRLAAIGLGLWAVGVQVSEAVAASGVVLTALAAGLSWAQRRKAHRPSLNLNDPQLYLMLFLAWALLAPLICGRLPTGTGLARLGDLLGIPLAMVALPLTNDRQKRGILISTGAVLAASSVLAALQHEGVLSYETYAPLQAMRVPVHRVFEPIPGAPGRFMAGGLLFHRLKFAHVSALGAIAFAGVGLLQRGTRRALCWALAALAGLSVLFFPMTRAAALSLLLSLGLLFLLWTPHKVRAGAAVGTALILALGALWLDAPLRQRFLSSQSEEGSGGRTYLRQAGLRAWHTHPWTGLGVGRFRVGEWASEDAPVAVQEHGGKAHFQLLSIAVETGLLGALLFAVFVAMLGLQLWRSRREAPWGVPALTFFLLLCALHDPLFHPEFGMALALTLGTAIGVQPPMSRRNCMPSNRIPLTA